MQNKLKKKFDIIQQQQEEKKDTKNETTKGTILFMNRQLIHMHIYELNF